MLWWRQVVGIIVLAACVSLVPLPGMKPYQLLQAHSKDPEIGIRYFSKTLEYYYVAIAASVRRVVGGGTSSKQRTVSERGGGVGDDHDGDSAGRAQHRSTTYGT